MRDLHDRRRTGAIPFHCRRSLKVHDLHMISISCTFKCAKGGGCSSFQADMPCFCFSPPLLILQPVEGPAAGVAPSETYAKALWVEDNLGQVINALWKLLVHDLHRVVQGAADGALNEADLSDREKLRRSRVLLAMGNVFKVREGMQGDGWVFELRLRCRGTETRGERLRQGGWQSLPSTQHLQGSCKPFVQGAGLLSNQSAQPLTPVTCVSSGVEGGLVQNGKMLVLVRHGCV